MRRGTGDLSLLHMFSSRRTRYGSIKKTFQTGSKIWSSYLLMQQCHPLPGTLNIIPLHISKVPMFSVLARNCKPGGAKV